MNIRRKEPDYKRRFLRYVKFDFFFVEQSTFRLSTHNLNSLHAFSSQGKKHYFRFIAGVERDKKKKKKEE